MAVPTAARKVARSVAELVAPKAAKTAEHWVAPMVC